jgi:hypothetical protein
MLASALGFAYKDAPAPRLSLLDGQSTERVDLAVPSGAERTVFTLQADYENFVQRARTELLSDGWREVRLPQGQPSATFVHHNANLEIFPGTLLPEALQPNGSRTWTKLDGVVTLLLDRSTANPFSRARDIAARLSGE